MRQGNTLQQLYTVVSGVYVPIASEDMQSTVKKAVDRDRTKVTGGFGAYPQSNIVGPGHINPDMQATGDFIPVIVPSANLLVGLRRKGGPGRESIASH
ncbi:uncharacterized protein LDX57_007604 [Aspergillus melleus]|uniref:uncharacterized protein n=1 Tax=Aspergillus melleus TaxID=138277 RepID=UPI001E8CE599|nr:uncharacterized protein LDX57_007604 [Aspergillus melleus]KAH8429931.1 hypothetical protein LDX57_007604 [Aspergillus melleus]